MRRVLVVGMSGSGKTTAARQIAQVTGLPFHEIDALVIGPGWSTPDDVADRIAALAAADSWVVDSWAPADLRDPLWSAADTLVWLDFPRRTVLPRLLRRSLRRSWTRESLFGGNVERWRDWASLDHPFWYAVRTFGARRRAIERLTQRHPQLTVVRCGRPSAFTAWIDGY